MSNLFTSGIGLARQEGMFKYPQIGVALPMPGPLAPTDTVSTPSGATTGPATPIQGVETEPEESGADVRIKMEDVGIITPRTTETYTKEESIYSI